MNIIDVTNDANLIRQVAEVLLDGFTTSGIQPWGNLAEAIAEVEESLTKNKISRAAIDENGESADLFCAAGFDGDS